MNKLSMVIILLMISTMVAAKKTIPVKGQFDTPIGTNSTGPATQGTAYEFSFVASPTNKITFATKIVESNDWFIAPANATGIHPHDIIPFQNSIIDITDLFVIYDAGTEMDQELGRGSFQAPRQSMPNSGPVDLNPLVRRVTQSNYLASDFIEVKLIRVSEIEFQTTIKVKYDSPSNISPGPWIIFSQDQNPLFTEGTRTKATGLESLAEDGNPKLLFTNL